MIKAQNNGIYIGSIGLFLLLLAATPFIKIPIYTSARGVVSALKKDSLSGGSPSLVIMCRLPLSSIGLLRSQQLVSIHMDAYPSQLWGALSATVIDTDNRPVIDATTNTSYINVYCQTDQNHLSLKDGHKVTVGEGHPLTARFSVAERTLWQLAFGRLEDIMVP
ncbi:hypothetical protein [Sphingobacterium sp. SYP-B4668]|uniref:hypothetical protein n=1 Tax=Sphingobacterium sp. SYP-B4668 TaxID=2996035 RepID=UPI0022DE50F0|nr:hypothetical protein [Sphingobacterium sp. SYP-B4668]